MKQILLKSFLYQHDHYRNHNDQNDTHDWIAYHKDYLYCDITTRTKL